jgi:polysaccharide biosynthesis transport protein
MGQLSPYLLTKPDRDPGIIDADFSPYMEEVEPWVKVLEYWRILRKRIRLVLAVFLGIFALAAIKDFNAVRLYTATATLLIESKMPQLFGDASGGPGSDDSDEYLSDDQTEYELLRSRSVAARVVQAEGLLKPNAYPPPVPTLSSKIRAWIKSLIPFSGSMAKEPTPQQLPEGADGFAVPANAIDGYLGMVKVTPIENTRMARVSVTTADPKLSARLANAHARQFIRRGIELNSQASEDASRFLSGKLADLKTQVEQSELALNNYRRDKGIIPGLISVNGKEDVVLERLNKISQDLQDAHLKTISLGTEVALVKEGRTDALPEVMESSLIQKLKGDLDVLQVEKAGMANQFKPNYPPMQQLDAKIRGTQAALAQEVRNTVSNLHQQYQAALEREKTLSQELDKQKSFALGLNDAAVRYLILEREADTNRGLYDSVLKRMKDMALLADVHASNVSVVDYAEPPGAPSSPNTSKDLSQAALLGLVLALGLAILLEHLDATLKFPDETQRYLGLPNLAVIPEFTFGKALAYYGAEGSRGSRDQNALEARTKHIADIVTVNGKFSVLSEAYRTLRTALLLSRAGNHPKITLVTSALPHEGKTTVAVNTAIVLAHTGAKVLLIDADLRKPRCHKVLSLKNHFGLTEMLTGGANEEAISPTKIENLFLLSSGRIPPSPSELLGSIRMREILESLSKSYEYIVVDSPPAMLVADAIVLSTMTDGVVLVAAGGQTPKQQARAAVTRLRQANAHIFGFVLNKVRINKFDYPYYHYSGVYHSGLYQGYYQDERYHKNGRGGDDEGGEDSPILEDEYKT